MLKQLSLYAAAFIGLTIIFSSCKKEYESIQSIDSKKIADFLAQNNINGLEDPDKTGFFYQIVTPGEGEVFANADSVLYNIEIKSLENPTIYFTTPTYTNLGTFVGYSNVINGTSIPAIRTAITQLKPGGVARIFLPSYLGFGKNGIADQIPSNENLEIKVTTYEKGQATLDDRLIREFIAKEGLTMIKDPSGVYYSVSAEGTDKAKTISTSTINATYTGRLTNGTVFDTGTDTSFDLATVIPGWRMTIPGKIGVGGKIRMLIPSHLAYGLTGGSGTTPIPPNAILDFDIEILKVTN